MTDFLEKYSQIFAGISALIGSDGSVNLYRPDTGDAVIIVSTMKFSAEHPLCVDSYFNEVRRIVGDSGKTKLTAECDPQSRMLVKITASIGT